MISEKSLTPTENTTSSYQRTAPDPGTKRSRNMESGGRSGLLGDDHGIRKSDLSDISNNLDREPASEAHHPDHRASFMKYRGSSDQPYAAISWIEFRCAQYYLTQLLSVSHRDALALADCHCLTQPPLVDFHCLTLRRRCLLACLSPSRTASRCLELRPHHLALRLVVCHIAPSPPRTAPSLPLVSHRVSLSDNSNHLTLLTASMSDCYVSDCLSVPDCLSRHTASVPYCSVGLNICSFVPL